MKAKDFLLDHKQRTQVMHSPSDHRTGCHQARIQIVDIHAAIYLDI
jgi:hypothetical protein